MPRGPRARPWRHTGVTYVLNINNRNLPGFRKCSKFVNSSSQCIPVGTRTPVPSPQPPLGARPRLLRGLRVGVASDSGQVSHVEKRHQGGFNIMGTFYSSGHYRLTLLVEQVSSVSVESVHLRNRGAVSPSDTVTAGPPRRRHKKQTPPSRSRPRGPRRQTVPLREAPAGRPVRGLCGKCPSRPRLEPCAQPGMHALWLRIE